MTCNKVHISSSLRQLSPCEPREKVIAVSWPNFTSVDHVSPSHVTVLRCSGGCHTNQQSCVASKRKKRQVAVMFGKCKHVNGGRCKKECNSVEVEDETECQCSCRGKKDECSENQEWKSDMCECQCKDTKSKRECLEWGNGKVWDSSKCECVCSNTLECTNGKFNSHTCKCYETSNLSIESSNAVQRAERSNTRIYINSWKIILIIILSCLVVSFFFIIASLLCKISSLRAAIKASQSDPYVMPRQLYDKDPGSPFQTLIKSSISEISSCPQCSLEAPTDSSICTDSIVSEVRSTPTQMVYSPNEICSFLPKETNI